MRFSLRHFVEVFNVRNKQGVPPLLIGGQAVNYWAELYSSEEPGLAKWQPFTSEDIDFQGSREDVRLIALQLGLAPVFPRPVEMTALAGMIPFKRGDLESQIEVVSSVPGVPAKLLQETALEATWEDYQIRVIDPISLLWAKAHLALKVPQKGRRDADHLAIMVLCVRAFLRGALSKVADDSVPARNWLAAVERVLVLSESTTGAKTAHRFGTDWTEVLPLKEIQGIAAPKIVTFRDRRLQRWKAKIGSHVRGVTPPAIR
ncbi:MAG: hypothetical protein ABSH38_21390 [Verrucomicrobiota bacterium]|jgi:hypothetical protein